MEKTSVNIPDPNQRRKFQSADSEYCICHPLDTGDLSALNVKFLDDQSIQSHIKQLGVRIDCSFEKPDTRSPNGCSRFDQQSGKKPSFRGLKTIIGSSHKAFKARSLMFSRRGCRDRFVSGFPKMAASVRRVHAARFAFLPPVGGRVVFDFP
jgi:hypothetical protein